MNENYVKEELNLSKRKLSERCMDVVLVKVYQVELCSSLRSFNLYLFKRVGSE